MTTKNQKLHRIFLELRIAIESDGLSDEHLDKIVSDPLLQAQVIKTVEAVLSGRLVVDFNGGSVTIDGVVYLPY